MNTQTAGYQNKLLGAVAQTDYTGISWRILLQRRLGGNDLTWKSPTYLLMAELKDTLFTKLPVRVAKNKKQNWFSAKQP